MYISTSQCAHMYTYIATGIVTMHAWRRSFLAQMVEPDVYAESHKVTTASNHIIRT